MSRCRTYPMCDPQGCMSDACPVSHPEEDFDVDAAVLEDQDERHGADPYGPETDVGGLIGQQPY
jgi:hypothetical protein